ncbi:MAG TPA: NAD(P)/FAD-dependent oxidoreductase [Nevskiaceae bacterium]
MKIAVIGAGFAGLSAVKVLTQFGHDVTVFEKAPDVGGVWSATRRYPGLRTQNNKGTYCFSDFPMPASYPEWPSSEQVQKYLADYVQHFNLGDRIQLNKEVMKAEPNGDKGWRLTVRDTQSNGTIEHDAERLVVANGIFSKPFIPPYKGRDEFEAAGGHIGPPSEFHDLEQVRGKNVIVVGYGKSACDAAAKIGEAAASTTVVARELIWKMPRKIMNVLNYKYLMLTRMGEGLFPYQRRRGFEKFLHDGPGRAMRNSMINSLQSVVTKQYKLKERGLVPRGSFDRIARSTVSLASDQLYEHVEQGTTEIIRDCEITRLGVDKGKPVAVLSNGRTIPADAVICGTGWQQETPFFSKEIEAKITDGEGNFMLWRQILPLEVPNVMFCGYNSSFYSPLSAEVASLWIATYLMGGVKLPPLAERRTRIEERLRWMKERTEGHHARGTNIIPFSMHNIDEMLDEIGANVSALTRFKQWLMPTNAKDYQSVTKRLLKRQHAPSAHA